MRTGWILLAAGLLAAGCDYRVPMAAKPDMEIDRSVVGLWQRTDGESGKEKERLLVLPLDEREYLVVYPAASPGAMIARACLCRSGDRTLVQLKWFGTAEGKVADDDRVYQFCVFDVKEDVLTVRMMNTSVVPKDIASSRALVKAVKAALQQPDLFRDKLVFGRIERKE